MTPQELAADLAIAATATSAGLKLGQAVYDDIVASIAKHRPELTASAPPESQEQTILDIADTQIKARFPGAE